MSQLPPTQPTLGVFRYSATFVGVIPPVGQNRAAGTGEWIAPQVGHSACGFRGEELHVAIAVFQQGQDFGDRGDARQVWQRGVAHRCPQIGRTARGDEKLRARGECVFGLRGVDDGACAYHDLRHLGGDAFDRGHGGGGTQRQLDDRQSAVDERLGDRHRVVGIVHDDHRNDGCDVEQ